jgi:predicted deacylase
MDFLSKNMILCGKRRSRWPYLLGSGLLAASLFSLGLYLFLIWRYPLSRVDQTAAQAAGPQRTRVTETAFGLSAKGRPISGYEIGTGDDVLLLFGAIHGNEMGTNELLEKLVNEFRSIPGLLPDEKKLVVIPVLNPDGYLDRTDNLNANRVNLNLNFDTAYWQKYGPAGTYAGPKPFSEKESLALKDTVEKYRPYAMVSFHSSGALISPEASPTSEALAKWLSAMTGYDYYDGWDYAGTATRWFEETTGQPAVTVEISKDLESDWHRNADALLDLIALPKADLLKMGTEATNDAVVP